MSKIDKIDLAVVDLLMEDGRMPSAEIARRVTERLGQAVSERAVRYRIDRLVSKGVIRVSAIVKPNSVGYSIIADVFIEVEAGRIQEVANQLAANPSISYVAFSIGETDVSAQVYARSTEEVYTFVTEVIGKIPGVRKTTTSIVPQVLKDVYKWKIPT